MSKSSKIALVVLFALFAVFAFWFPSKLSEAQSRIEDTKKEAAVAADETLILAASDWNPSSINLRTTQGLANNAGQLNALFMRCKADLGTLIEGRMSVTEFSVTDRLLIADLSGSAIFANGEATVKMRMTREPGNSWMLDSFDVIPLKPGQQSSGRFLDPAPSGQTPDETEAPRSEDSDDGSP